MVAVTSVLATLAIPNALRARINASEARAISSLRRISTACEGYRTSRTSPTYPNLLTDLSDAIPPYIDTVLSSGTKQGYTFVYEPNLPYQYSCTASPVNPGSTGVRTFVVDETGVITSDGVAIE